jgi:hypothetical protein
MSVGRTGDGSSVDGTSAVGGVAPDGGGAGAGAAAEGGSASAIASKRARSTGLSGNMLEQQLRAQGYADAAGGLDIGAGGAGAGQAAAAPPSDGLSADDVANQQSIEQTLGGLSVSEIQAKLADPAADPKQIAQVARLLACSNDQELYGRYMQALSGYCASIQFEGHARLEDICDEMIWSSGPGASMAKGDFAVILQNVIDLPEMHVGHYVEKLDRLIQSDPQGIFDRLQPNADNPAAGAALPKILETVARFDPDALSSVVGSVATSYAQATREYNDARQGLVAADRNAAKDPGALAAAQQRLNDAEDAMRARAHDLGYSLGTAENVIGKIAQDDAAKELAGLRFAKGVLSVLSKGIDLIPGEGQAVELAKGVAGAAADPLVDALAGLGEDRVNSAYKDWRDALNAKFGAVIREAYRASAPDEQRNARPGSAAAKRFSDAYKVYQDQFQAGLYETRSQ